MYAITGINRSFRAASQVFYEARGSNHEAPIKGYGDYKIAFYKLPKTTANLCDPIGESANGFFVGTFRRDFPYETSDTVTRDRFNDSFFGCQCHENSYARLDQYQTANIQSFGDMLNTLGLVYDPQPTVLPDDDWRRELHPTMSQLFSDPIDKVPNPAGFSRLWNWHIIEDCGNFRTLTAESDTHYYCFEYITS